MLLFLKKYFRFIILQLGQLYLYFWCRFSIQRRQRLHQLNYTIITYNSSNCCDSCNNDSSGRYALSFSIYIICIICVICICIYSYTWWSILIPLPLIITLTILSLPNACRILNITTIYFTWAIIKNITFVARALLNWILWETSSIRISRTINRSTSKIRVFIGIIFANALRITGDFCIDII